MSDSHNAPQTINNIAIFIVETIDSIIPLYRITENIKLLVHYATVYNSRIRAVLGHVPSAKQFYFGFEVCTHCTRYTNT